MVGMDAVGVAGRLGNHGEAMTSSRSDVDPGDAPSLNLYRGGGA